MRIIPWLALGAAACITVNIYFPAPQVRAAAEQIVEETWGQGSEGGEPQAPAPVDDAPGAPDPGGAGALLEWMSPRSAHAQAAADHPDVDVSTAAIRKLKDAMKARAAELRPYLAKGHVGVGADGMLVVRDTAGLSLGDQAKLRRHVEAENRDRKTLYAEIAEANGYPRDRIADIQKIFAETWIEKAEPGWYVQRGGAWARK
jgi:uncharacterized protein YdbL (DUF1318 family)